MESTKPIEEVLSELRVRSVARSEESRYREEMARHHYLGDLAKIGETIWYVAIWQDQWVALVSSFNASLKLIGDVENWSRTIENDMNEVTARLEQLHAQRQRH